jgi:HEAT repeat protein
MRLRFYTVTIALALAALLVLLTVSCSAPEERKSQLAPDTVAGKWAAKLDDADYAVRERAVLNLGRLNEAKAVPELVAALEDPDWHVRAAAAWALVMIGDDSDAAVEALSKVYLRDGSAVAMGRASEALIRIGAKARGTFIKGLESPYWYVRYLAAQALAREGSDDAIGPIVPLLNDREFDVRFAAASALYEIGGDGRVVIDNALEGKELPEELVKRLAIKDVKKLKFLAEKKEGVIMAINMAGGTDDDIQAIATENKSN